jgi:WbqC-like protein family
MQPYVFPYLGYYQLLHAADDMVLFDDVNFIKKGWINRNRIKLNGEELTFTIPIQGLSQNATILASRIAPDGAWKGKLRASLQHAYAKAPGFARHFTPIMAMIEDAQGSIADLAEQSIRYVANEAQLPVRIHRASHLALPAELKGADRILAIARAHGAARYINPANGAGLYNEEIFTAAGVELRFLRMSPTAAYVQQGATPFITGLSIIDVLMNTDREELRMLLGRYDLYTGAALNAAAPQVPTQSA